MIDADDVGEVAIWLGLIAIFVMAILCGVKLEAQIEGAKSAERCCCQRRSNEACDSGSVDWRQVDYADCT